MTKQDKDSNLLVGVLIGGAIGIGALTIFLATRKEKAPLGSIGEAILHIGEILEKHHIKEPAAMQRVEKTIQNHESCIGEVMEWVSAGINLWKQFKK